jgi:hypothetical protein
MPSKHQRAELVCIYRNLDAILVHMARDFLREARIESYIFDAETSRMLGIVRGRAAVPPRLMVYADRAEEARKVLKALKFK